MYLCNVDVLHTENNIILDVHVCVKYLIRLIGFLKQRDPTIVEESKKYNVQNRSMQISRKLVPHTTQNL